MRTAVLLALFLHLLGTNTIAFLGPSSSEIVQVQVLPGPTMGTDSIDPQNISTYSEVATRWIREYLRINTTNPPGHEAKAAAFFKNIFDQEGIENEVIEFAPGRANIWARIRCRSEASPCRRPLILLNHTDVVTAEASHWRVPPFSATVLDGVIYGRGARDMKNEGIAQAVALVMLKRENVQLDRDVIFLATGDEEVDNMGSKWIIQNRRELLGNAEFLITEGGQNAAGNRKVEYVGIDVAEKTPLWLHVTARGHSGHGSQPIPDSAPDKLIAALKRITEYKPELRVTPVVEQFLRAMAPLQPEQRAAQFRNIRYVLQDRHAREQLRADGSLTYLLQDTVAVTMLGGSGSTNVIPDEAWANVDARLLPGTDPQEFLEKLRRAVNDPGVTIEPLKPFTAANESPTNTELWDAIDAVSQKYFNGAPLIPYLTTGYTENQLYRQLGIVCYGFSSYTDGFEESGTEHGDNERVRVEDVRRAPLVLYDLIVRVAGASHTRMAAAAH